MIFLKGLSIKVKCFRSNVLINIFLSSGGFGSSVVSVPGVFLIMADAVGAFVEGLGALR